MVELNADDLIVCVVIDKDFAELELYPDFD